MNLVGKIFVVAILIMSVVYMGFAIAVYATHRNWKEAIYATEVREDGKKGLIHQVADKQAEIDQLQEEWNKLDTKLNALRNEKNQQLAKLDTALQEAIGERDQSRKELAELEAANRVLAGTVDSTQQNNTRITAENEGLRQEIRDAQKARDEAFDELVALTDQLHDKHGKWVRLKEREQVLVAQIGHYKQKMAEVGIKNPDAQLVGAAPQIDGLVTAVRENSLIEVSIGADDGIRPGHTLEVFRDRTYLGKALIVRTSPDKAVAKIMPETRRGVIQKGDRVATRLTS